MMNREGRKARKVLVFFFAFLALFAVKENWRFEIGD